MHVWFPYSSAHSPPPAPSPSPFPLPPPLRLLLILLRLLLHLLCSRRIQGFHNHAATTFSATVFTIPYWSSTFSTLLGSYSTLSDFFCLFRPLRRAQTAPRISTKADKEILLRKPMPCLNPQFVKPPCMEPQLLRQSGLVCCNSVSKMGEKMQLARQATQPPWGLGRSITPLNCFD